jgi:hypothetical protein
MPTPIGRTLFKLLVPLEMEPFLGGTTEMQLEVDGGTAGIPWEYSKAIRPGLRSTALGDCAKLLQAAHRRFSRAGGHAVPTPACSSASRTAIESIRVCPVHATRPMQSRSA